MVTITHTKYVKPIKRRYFGNARRKYLSPQAVHKAAAAVPAVALAQADVIPNLRDPGG
jgi:hypothetical protein